MKHLVSFLLLFLSMGLGAEEPFEAARIAMRTAGVEDGLPNPRVHCTFLDRKGRFWVGTQEGAAFLGGNGWTSFPLPQGAPSIFIRAMAETADGSLWFGTEAGGLWRYRKGQWRHWSKNSGLPVPRVNALLAFGNELWVGTGGGGLLRWKNDGFEAVQGPLDPWVWTLASIPDGAGQPQLWVGGEKQLWVQQGQAWRRLGAKEGFWDLGANAIVPRRRAGGTVEVWISSWKKGVGRWDPTLNHFEGLVPGSPSKSPTALAVVPMANGEDEVWVGTYDMGLAKYSARGWEFLGPAQGFPSPGIYCLLVNPKSRPALWAGTRAGLVSVDPAGWRSLAEHPSLPSRQANCFLETLDARGDKTFWIGTDRGLVRWNKQGIRVDGIAQGLPADFITDIQSFEGPKGPEIWVGTLGGVARQNGSRWQASAAREGLAFYRVNCLAADRTPQGHLRVYAGGDGGVAYLEAGRWHMLEGGEGLPKNVIVTSLLCATDSDGGSSVWVGMRGGGIARLKAGGWQLFGARDGLHNLSVNGLAASIAPGGRRWLWATMIGGGGLARLDMDSPQKGFQTWDGGRIPGFPNQGIQRVGLSPEGALFLTTSRGVVRLDLQGTDWDPWRALTFGISDGLPGAASESGAVYLDRSGRVWVGTAKGVAVLDPGLDNALSFPDPPLIEQVRVQGLPVDHEAPIRLTHRDHRLRIGFGLPTFLRHEANLYRSQLLGLESQAQEWTPQAEREFTTLPPRTYILRIWGRDGLGRESAPVDLTILVEPPLWQTWWARTLLLLGTAGLVLLGVRWRHRFLILRASSLEKMVAERTEELAEANDALHLQSVTDPLTGLANRRSLHEQIGGLTSRMFRRYQSAQNMVGNLHQDLAFVILDLDHFKEVNDSFGHQVGDRVLEQAADLLRGTMREGDLLIRWGGEEFMVVAVDAHVEEIPLLAERIRASFAGHAFDTGKGSTLRRTVSLGFAFMPLIPAKPEAYSWEQVVSLADQCLFKAKQSGRNRWVGLIPAAESQVEGETLGLTLEQLTEAGWVEQMASWDPISSSRKRDAREL